MNKAEIRKFYQRLEKIDKKSLKSGNLLNKGFPLKNFRKNGLNLTWDKNAPNIIFSDPRALQATFIGIKNSDVDSDIKKMEPHILLEKASKNDELVPFGIIYTIGEWLEDYEIEENIQSSKRSSRASKVYDIIPIIHASPLKTLIHSGRVDFRFDSTLLVLKENLEVSVDFSDGNGFQEVSANKVIRVNYSGAGEKSIAVKIVEGDFETLIYSKVNLIFFDGDKPDEVFDLSGSGPQSSVSSRVQSLSGGFAELYNGCDRLFNKPVIIVEGYDPLNQFGINSLRNRYAGLIETRLRASGFDVIYLNFSDGGTDIRANAKVLERLLLDVKGRIGTNDKIVIVGESMGGLVSRYCLNDLESRNIQHDVSHFISFDTPHLGANVPVGYQKLIQDLDDIDFLNLFDIQQSKINEALAILDRPAAKQMLLRYKGSSPHQDFISFQNELSQGGFPSQGGIKNIAIINGSNLGTQQNPVGSFNPGDLFLNINWITGPFGASIKLRTNSLNNSSTVSQLSVVFGPIPTTNRSRSYTFDGYNYDVVTGGFEDNQDYIVNGVGFARIFNMWEWFFGYDTIETYNRDFFSFVPTFSSLASSRPRSQQSHLNTSVSQLISNGWTPFDEIYSQSTNTQHISVNAITSTWSNLLTTKFGADDFLCDSPNGIASPPPIPRFNTTQWFMCPNETRNFWITNESTVDNLFVQGWQVTGPNNFIHSSNSNQLILSGLTPGSYTINLIRSYSGGVFSGIATSSSRVLTVYPTSHASCDGGSAGGPIARLNTDSLNDDQALFLKKSNNQISEISFWPNPADNRVTIEYSVKEETMVKIDLIPASSSNSRAVPLSIGPRPVGKYNEVFNIDHVPSGLYVIQIQTDEQVLQKRIIIK